MEELHSALVSPRGVWWKPAGKQEKAWVTVSFVWCMILFAMMPLWHIKGGQNPSGIRARVDPVAYYKRVEQFVADYKIGEESGVPIVAPPPGADVYLLGRMWQWYPALQLEEGKSYTLHLSSLDLNHGFNLQPFNINFQVVPGYDYGLRVTPNRAGDFRVLCNEYCGIGHHLMIGKVVVRIRLAPVESAGGDHPPPVFTLERDVSFETGRIRVANLEGVEGGFEIH